MPKPPVTYVLGDSSHAGGVAVVLWHASGLRARGWDCEVFAPKPAPAWWAGPDPGWRAFPHTDQLGAALRERRGVKVGTFVPIWGWVADNLNPGDRGYGLLQDFDGATYRGDPGLDARMVRTLEPITESRWVQTELRTRHNVAGHYVGIGLNPVFRPLPMVRGPLRVTCAARPQRSSYGDLKGWDVAQEAVRIAARSVKDLGLVTFGPQAVPAVPGLAHVHLTYPNDRTLRQLYAETTVFLSASRHEGFGLPIAEAMACGSPVVCTDAGGNREFCRDGETCLMAPPGDPHALAARLVEAFADPLLRARLGAAGREETRRYRWDHVLDRLEALYYA